MKSGRGRHGLFARFRTGALNVRTVLVHAQRLPVIGVPARVLLFVVLGVDIPASVHIGPGFRMMHGGYGVVVHRNTTFGRSVTIFHGVTIGLGTVGVPEDHSSRFDIGDGVVLSTGAVILNSTGGVLSIGAGSVVGANSVLTRSIGPGEVWAGVPARRVGSRAARHGPQRGINSSGDESGRARSLGFEVERVAEDERGDA